MRKVTLTIDGDDYVALPKADYLRLVEGAGEKTVDALEFTLISLGRNLKTAREHAGLSQAELAKKLGKAQTTVSQAEAGKIRVSEKYVLGVLSACGLPDDWRAPVYRTRVGASNAVEIVDEANGQTVIATTRRWPGLRAAEHVAEQLDQWIADAVASKAGLDVDKVQLFAKRASGIRC
jgi:transcriptional regulator with XRE-family HTH domain